MGYNVAFSSKQHTGQPGVKTWTSYKNKDDFLKKLPQLLINEDIVAVGFPDNGYEAITNTHPFYYHYANLAQSFDKETGTFNTAMFESQKTQTEWFTSNRCPASILAVAQKLVSGEVTEVPLIEVFFMP